LAFQSAGSAISRWSAWKEGGTSGKIIEKWMRVPFGIAKSLGFGTDPVRSWTPWLGGLSSARRGKRRGGASSERWDSRTEDMHRKNWRIARLAGQLQGTEPPQALPCLALPPHCPAQQARQTPGQEALLLKVWRCSGAQQCSSMMMAAWWCRGPEGKSRWPSIGCKLETAAGYAVRVPLSTEVRSH